MVTTIRKNLPPKEGLSIVSVEDENDITVVNIGDTDLLVTAVVFHKFPAVFGRPTAQIVEAHKPKSLEGIETKKLGYDQWREIVTGKSDAEWESFVKTKYEQQGNSGIIRPMFCSSNSAKFQKMLPNSLPSDGRPPIRFAERRRET